MKNILIVLFLVAILILNAEIIFVPDDYVTIQEALNGVAENDTIIINPGIYFEENLNFYSKNLVLASQFLLTGDSTFVSETIINAGQEGSVFIFESNESTSAMICGLTITGANDTAIRCDNSSPTLKNLIITGNSGFNGGGLYLNYSNAVLLDLVISYNSAEFAMGGGFCLNYSNPILKNLVISHNEAAYGSAISIHSCPDLIFENLTISENINYEPYVFGSVYIVASNNLVMKNCISWNNENEEIYLDDYFEVTHIDISYSDIENGINEIYVGMMASYDWLEGNIDSDPLFVDPQNDDFHLTENSPCIDAGDPISNPDPDGTITDMGALYFHQGTDAEKNQLTIQDLQLSNYPNPFNPETTISFIVENETELTELNVYNIKGQKITTLLQTRLSAGQHFVVWDGTDSRRLHLTSGVYLFGVKNGQCENFIKAILLK
ncbi:MAG: T9SS type A sorting domain-containing protein [Armatimonadetes bacterium]|nr:T9SS type A sorting domain-containing protein [Armatimonadota bacterium]